MSRKQQLDDEVVREMRRLMSDGLGVQECADKFKLPYFTMYQIRRGWTYPNAGGPIAKRSRGKLTAAKAERIRELREKGATIDQLAQAAGLGRTSIKKALAGHV